jgi:hypothetical protein
MTADMKRDRRAYYALCPEDSDHFILLDPSDTCWKKTPPRAPVKRECLGCGPHYEVNIGTDWQVGYVSQDDLEHGFTYSKPAEQPESSGENAEATCP